MTRIERTRRFNRSPSVCGYSVGDESLAIPKAVRWVSITWDASSIAFPGCGWPLFAHTCTLGSKLDDLEKRWRRLVVHGVVSEDAAFDARRTASVKPTPRFFD